VHELERRRLLVIDDDATLRAVVAETLRGDGYRVDEAANGAEALDRLRADPPDLILLDLQMPGLDGFGFLDQYKQSGAPDIPIVVITATPELPEAARDLGVKAVLTKPFDIGLLTAMVERLARAADAEQV
jgi:CheY-like chemotaxis protein